MRHSPISLLPVAVAKFTGQPAPSSRKTYELVLQGLVPAERIRGRWYYLGDEAVKAAAEALGMIADDEAA